MKPANLVPLVFLCISTTFAQTVRYPVSLPHIASGAYSNGFVNVLSARTNAASLASVEHFNAGVYGERRFMLEEISTYTAAAAIPTQSGNFALMTDYFGYSGYNESEVSIGYGRRLSKRIDLGVAFNYYSIRIPLYGKAFSYNFELGSIIHISETLHTGVRIYNPLRSRLGEHGSERLASSYTVGLGYEPSSNFLSTLEIIKEEDKPVAIHAGIQYHPIRQLFAVVGYITANNQFYFGAGYLHKQIRVDMMAGFHQLMGMSPGLMIVYMPEKKKQ
ncbi:MAG: hypothetical protein KIT80_02865 [Chitinophagaceae bacterium]|nr:hypothetical protein [Chitinophagaceae bacterium]MCW5925827.1 hypothetical protein [Chitinophagaceae bacterium]